MVFVPPVSGESLSGKQEGFTVRKSCSFTISVSFCLLGGLVLVASVFLASCAQSSATGETLSFTSFDPPGSAETISFHINDLGEVVGIYYDSLNAGHGFLLQGGSFSIVDFAGEVGGVQPEGINNSIEITGAYGDSNQVVHGFLLQPDGSLMNIDPPASAGYTEAAEINNSGTIVGRYYGNSGGFQGFVFSNGSYTTINVPGATNTSLFGINNRGDIVGDYIDASGVTHGLLLSNGNMTTIDFPGSTNTNSQSINDRGEIVGSTVIGGVRHGYLFRNGNFSRIDFPGASLAVSGAPLSGTDVHGINASSEIAGTYTDTSGVIHGFLAKSAGVVPLIFDVPNVSR